MSERTCLYILPQTKKIMMISRAETERKECWKKKERTGGCGAPQGVQEFCR